MIFAIGLKKLILSRRTKSSVRATTTKSNNAANFIRVTSAYLGDRKILFSKSVTLNIDETTETRLFEKVGFLEPFINSLHYYF
jgi:nitrate reductase gamma subunit